MRIRDMVIDFVVYFIVVPVCVTLVILIGIPMVIYDFLFVNDDY